MPEMDGLQAARLIHAAHPQVAIIMLTSSEVDKHLLEAIRLGASGYLLKNLDANELFDLLGGVARGEAALTRSMASRLAQSVANQPTQALVELTERELDILKLIARGASNNQIAAELFIAVNTVKYHLKNILAKLELENRTQAAAYALQHGIVLPDEADSDG
jgi:NarL family two-component system response regulator LiaR